MSGAVPRRCIAGGSAWEPQVGYSRAVRCGNAVFVSGTVGDGADAYAQAKAALAAIEKALVAAGGIAAGRRAHPHLRHQHRSRLGGDRPRSSRGVCNDQTGDVDARSLTPDRSKVRRRNRSRRRRHAGSLATASGPAPAGSGDRSAAAAAGPTAAGASSDGFAAVRSS